MAPKRRNVPRRSDRRLAALIARQMAAVLPNLVTELSLNNPNGSANSNGTNNPTCTYKHFNSCNPPKFSGNEGATGLLQWFEGIENTFLNSDCPEDRKVRHATGVLQKRALTWWNGEKRNRGAEATMALTWDEVKELMVREFCPRNEVKKLETEFWDLKQDSGENLAYTTRFHELSLLVPHLVTPLSRAIEKYINGLPMQIQDTVLGSNPTTLDEAIRLAATLTDNHVKAGTLTKKGGKKSTDKTIPEPVKEDKAEASSSLNKKRKANNYAVVTPAVPLNTVAPTAQAPKKIYTGVQPVCDTCKYHHPVNMPCRHCTNCGRYGHTNNLCRAAFMPQGNQAIAPNPVITARACYNCGDPNHMRNQCPKLLNNAPPARGRVFNINETQANNNVENGS